VLVFVLDKGKLLIGPYTPPQPKYYQKMFHNEKESTRALARCQVSLEKSSKNYSRCENEPSQATCIAFPLPHPPAKWQVLVVCFPRGGAKHAKKRRQEIRKKITPQK
jgi:hypothetical protein